MLPSLLCSRVLPLAARTLIWLLITNRCLVYVSLADPEHRTARCAIRAWRDLTTTALGCPIALASETTAISTVCVGVLTAQSDAVSLRVCGSCVHASVHVCSVPMLHVRSFCFVAGFISSTALLCVLVFSFAATHLGLLTKELKDADEVCDM